VLVYKEGKFSINVIMEKMNQSLTTIRLKTISKPFNLKLLEECIHINNNKLHGFFGGSHFKDFQ